MYILKWSIVASCTGTVLFGQELKGCATEGIHVIQPPFGHSVLVGQGMHAFLSANGWNVFTSHSMQFLVFV